ncbi:MAG TPA: heterodisulfide reductase-related iron-sulfur binding cluster [Chloroflexota bacterium]|nr:heterodisulfide reductase-related iron-sulfur binding cluster [Chloroflexota bacterium]
MTDVGEATRVVQWNTTPVMIWFMYGTMVVALGIFAYGIWRRVRLWRLGKPVVRWNRPGTRLKLVLIRGLGQTSLLKDRFPGLMHALIFYGFGILFLATVVVAINTDLHVPIMHGYFYLYFQSLIVDLFGLFCFVGIAIAVVRRYLVRPRRLERGKPADAILLCSLGLILLTGFMIEGLRIVATGDPWAVWSPVGNAVGRLLAIVLTSEPALRTAHASLWIVHVALWHTLLAVIPFTKLIHLVTSPLNIFFGNLDEAHGLVPTIDFADATAALGIKTVDDLTWKQLFDFDACTECGRCQDACPAYAEGKPLSPKRVILDLRDFVHANADALITAHAAHQTDASAADESIGGQTVLAGGVIKPETLWSCTTCRACEEVCPVAIEHVSLIVGLRRNLAMDLAELPVGVAEVVSSLEVRQHPFRGASVERTEWYQDLPVSELSAVADASELEALYWVGCAAALDPRIQKVARALVRVMDHAGVRFAVLGPEEQCCGEPARRTGNEFHYDTLARANVEILQRTNVRQIVTHCPHCLQTLKHDYRQLGGDFAVVHHSEFVRQLIEKGRVRLARPIAQTVTFHDPCYLGRYNGQIAAPRLVLDRLGVERREMKRSGKASFCCGAGGGHAFFEDGVGGRINQNRAREAVATGAKTVCTGCPFCLGMLEDGVKSVQSSDGQVQVRDFVELVAEALAE